MKTTRAAFFWTVVLSAAAIGGWSVGRSASGIGEVYRDPPDFTNSATVRVHGAIAANAQQTLNQRVREGPAILLMLDGVELRNCGDLGRQIRELYRAVEGRVPILLSAGDTPRDEVEWFLRSERLPLRVIDAIRAQDFLQNNSVIPTPAAVWTNPNFGNAVGFGHIERYPYVRSASFAKELEPYYAATQLDTTRRLVAPSQGPR